MPFLTEESNNQEVFGPTPSDDLFFASFHRFLADVEVGASSEIPFSPFTSRKLMTNFAKGQRDADRLLEQMLPCLDNQDLTVYQRIFSRVAIAYLEMLYRLRGYTYGALKELAQECLNMLKNVEIRCNPGYFQKIFAKHQEMAVKLRTWYERRICILDLRDWTARNPNVFEDPKWVEEESEDELEETNELLQRRTI